MLIKTILSKKGLVNHRHQYLHPKRKARLNKVVNKAFLICFSVYGMI